MPNHLVEIFEDEKLVEKIKRRLPYLFQLAKLESSRAGKKGLRPSLFYFLYECIIFTTLNIALNL